MATKIKSHINKIAVWQLLLAKKIEEYNATIEITDSALTGGRVHWEWFQTETPRVVVQKSILHEEDDAQHIAVMLHEIGHLIDCAKFDNYIEKYTRAWGTLEMEVSAWERAFELAVKIGFTHFDELREEALRCLLTYFNGSELRLDYMFNFNHRGDKKVPTFEEAQDRMNAAYKSAKKQTQKALLGL